MSINEANFLVSGYSFRTGTPRHKLCHMSFTWASLIYDSHEIGQRLLVSMVTVRECERMLKNDWGDRKAVMQSLTQFGQVCHCGVSLCVAACVFGCLPLNISETPTGLLFVNARVCMRNNELLCMCMSVFMSRSAIPQSSSSHHPFISVERRALNHRINNVTVNMLFLSIHHSIRALPVGF